MARGAPKAADPAADAKKPTFDVVRVEPTGESVIAGRGKPDAQIALLDNGKPIARAKADANGQVAFLPPTLAPGEHSLMLSTGDPDTASDLSSQSVTVSVPEKPQSIPMVALIAPDQPARILSGPVAGPPTPQAGSTDATSSAMQAVAIRTVEVEDLGSFYATGHADPGSHCRIYLNGSFVATVTAGHDGIWSLQIKKGMKPGRYAVRADQVESKSGKVIARAEVPFDYPKHVRAAASLLKPQKGPADPKLASPASNPVSPSAAHSAAPVASSGAAPGIPPSGSHVAQTPLLPTTSAAPQSSGTDSPTAAGATQVASSAQPTASGQGAVSGSSSAVETPPLPPTVIAELLTTKVIHGDTLWRISRKILGHGIRYTQIYAANTVQIRDPRWIYPGQIFVMPQTATP